LPAGIASVSGRFHVGEPVTCEDARGRQLARGLTAYSSSEIERIRGLPTREIVQVLGYSNGDAVIHRDRLVVLDPPQKASDER
jgi:glutamate 5-kinase